MSETEIRPGGEDGEIEKAIAHIHMAEQDIAHARTEEARAEHELEAAVEELEDPTHKDHWVIVNGQRKEIHANRVTFEEIVHLAFPELPTCDGAQFTVQYTRGPERKPNGTLVEGQSVKVKDGMEFDVTPTNRS